MEIKNRNLEFNFSALGMPVKVSFEKKDAEIICLKVKTPISTNDQCVKIKDLEKGLKELLAFLKES